MNDRALKIAWEAHLNQKRKGSNIPYIVHPIEVAVILIENGAEEDVITAGLLHDTIEDTNVTVDYIKDNFGIRILEIIKGASEIEKLNSNTKFTNEEKINSWKERKKNTVNYLKNASIEVKLVACADKLSNIRSMSNEFMTLKNDLWQKFNAGCIEQKWYYESLLESLRDISDYKMYKEFKAEVKKLFQNPEVIKYINK